MTPRVLRSIPTMTTSTAPTPFAALDACHQNIQKNLDRLQLLIGQIEKGALTEDSRRSALEIANFFTTEARQHHAEEEEDMFPGMLKRGNAERVAQIRSLIEDHFWIEKYSHDLMPMLAALGASSESSESGKPAEPVDSAAMLKTAQLFHALCCRHIEFEETMIYPQAKARMARE